MLFYFRFDQFSKPVSLLYKVLEACCKTLNRIHGTGFKVYFIGFFSYGYDYEFQDSPNSPFQSIT